MRSVTTVREFHIRTNCVVDAVVVVSEGRVVRRYASLKDFHASECGDTNIATISKRLSGYVDGWLEDDCIARYEGEEKIFGRKLHTEKSRKPTKKISEKQRLKNELYDTRYKLQELQRKIDNGEISRIDAVSDLGWLQNHISVLEQRLKISSKKEV